MTEPEIQRGTELYLAYFHEAQRLHDAELGRPLEMYKDTDPRCVERAFERLVGSGIEGPAFVAEILHELAWSQCLGNGNHRTAILFLGDFLSEELGAAFEGARYTNGSNEWIESSQAIIRRRGEWGYNQSGLENRHRAQTVRWVARVLVQSESLMTIGPKRLLNFLSGKSSSSVRTG